jgi:hypothetical protein
VIIEVDGVSMQRNRLRTPSARAFSKRMAIECCATGTMTC